MIRAHNIDSHRPSPKVNSSVQRPAVATMKLSIVALSSFFLASSSDAFSFTAPMPRVAPRIARSQGAGDLTMISTGDDRSERRSLDISKTTYTSLVKAPKDAYIAVSD
jgi:hypothetical protein